MIKFFRQIRKRLLSEGELNEVMHGQNQSEALMESSAKERSRSEKASSRRWRYLKYAVGEIILVVIGILIALQINNWNQNRKTIALTKSYLSNIKNDLQTDTATFEEALTRLERTMKNVESLMSNDFISKLSPDSLFSSATSSFHSVRIYKINNSTYLKMTNTGFVESESFRSVFLDINDYYNKEHNTYSEYLNWDIEVDRDVFNPEFLNEWYDKITLPELIKWQKVEFLSDSKEQSESAFRSYLKSPRFKNFTWSYIDRKNRIVSRMKFQKRIAEELIEKINKELELD